MAPFRLCLRSCLETNRLQGVTATCYYKEMVEDMYGDLHENIVLWDAAEYAQENPLFTDENGMYRWDVPQGLWQVKFERRKLPEQLTVNGFPVPPPQLEVNIGMVQTAQPTVTAIRGYETGIEIDFSKFMLPETMTAEFITLTRNGEAGWKAAIQRLSRTPGSKPNKTMLNDAHCLEVRLSLQILFVQAFDKCFDYLTNVLTREAKPAC